MTTTAGATKPRTPLRADDPASRHAFYPRGKRLARRPAQGTSGGEGKRRGAGSRSWRIPAGLLGRCRAPGDKLLGPSSLNFGRKETRSGREKKQQLRQRANPRAISAGKQHVGRKETRFGGKNTEPELGAPYHSIECQTFLERAPPGPALCKEDGRFCRNRKQGKCRSSAKPRRCQASPARSLNVV